MHIQVGMNARLFPSNWRPVREEIAFAREHGFAHLQLPGPEQGLDAARLGDSIETVGALLRAGGAGTVMEMLILLGPDGHRRWRDAARCAPGQPADNRRGWAASGYIGIWRAPRSMAPGSSSRSRPP